MEIKLSRDAQFVQAKLYKAYLEQRKNGYGKGLAREIADDKISELFADKNRGDVIDALDELKRNGLIKSDIIGNIYLCDALIISMENRFKDGLNEVLSFLSQFIP